MKTCWKCKVEKDFGEFYKNQKACKSCQRVRNLTYIQNNKEYFKIKGAERYVKCLEDSEFNKKRYQADKEGFIERSVNYRKTIQGQLKNLVAAAQYRSEKRKMACDIDYEFINQLYENQNKLCALTRLPFSGISGKMSETKARYNKHNISIDRIDSSIGYTKDNVRLVLVCVNLALNSFGDENLELISTEFLRTKGYTVIKNN